MIVRVILGMENPIDTGKVGVGLALGMLRLRPAELGGEADDRRHTYLRMMSELQLYHLSDSKRLCGPNFNQITQSPQSEK